MDRSAWVERRQGGGFEQETFDRYNEAMVALSDEHIREMYQAFMMVYVDEADGETLAKLGLAEDDVDDAVLGFAEMMTIKLGELMDARTFLSHR